MRIILEPKVYLIGQQTHGMDLLQYLIDNEGVQWSTHADSSGEVLCEVGGRICYDSFNTPRPGGNKAYLERILSQAHGSVLEHAVYTFILSDISRSCTHELVRHRAGWAYSMRSQRYVDEGDAAMVLPEGLRDSYLASLPCPKSEKEEDLLVKRVKTDPFYQWEASCKLSLSAYRALIEQIEVDGEGTEKRKKLRQTARSVLPSCTSTHIQVTVNARALRHFIEMRASGGADPEIRRLAGMMWDRVIKVSPVLFGDYTREKLEDGTFELITSWKKV